MNNFIKYVWEVKYNILILMNCIIILKSLTKYIDSLNIKYLVIIVLLVILSALVMYRDEKYRYTLLEEETDENI